MADSENPYEDAQVQMSLLNNTANLVRGKFYTTEDLIDLYSGRTLELVSDLVQTINDFNPEIPELDEPDITVPDYPTFSISTPNIQVIPPLDTGAAPNLRGEIQPIVLDSPEKPNGTILSDPAPEFSYEEVPYISDLLDNLKLVIDDIVENGGQGLSDEVFLSTLDLAHTADDIEYEKLYDDAENYFASKGYTVPPGALVARLNLIGRERYRNQQRITSELTNKQAELAYQQYMAMVELGIKLEDLTMSDKNNVANRAYEYSKDIVLFFYSALENSIKAYQAELEAYKTEWLAEETKVKAIAAANKSITDILVAETSAYEINVKAQLAVIESITKVYVAEMSGYEVSVKAESIKTENLIEQYKADIEMGKLSIAYQSQDAELILRAAIAKWEASLKGSDTVGKLSGQITSAALSAVNASASMSASVGSSYSRSKSDSESESTSTNYNYSVSE